MNVSAMTADESKPERSPGGRRALRARKWKDAGTNNHRRRRAVSTAPAENTTGGSENGDRSNNNRRRRRPTTKKAAAVSDDGSLTSATCSPSDSSTSSDSWECAQPKSSQHAKLGRRKAPQRKRGGSKSSKLAGKKSLNVVHIDDVSEEDKLQYVALDAEMVGVGYGGFMSALARVSVVNWEGEVIFDAHVRPTLPVTDYRTFVSGITESDLESDDVLTLEQCQLLLEPILHNKIIVGHGLKNDFRVMGIHPEWHNVRDTAKYEPFMKPDPMYPAEFLSKKLKVLAKDKLGMIIQEDDVPHCPVEDAVAAMELYKKHRSKWEKAVHWKVNRTKQITAQ